ncbi:GH12 family glycosyl hydrolase domain-containing protein [Actinomadura opuntiae]|uniref:GH12 family glycosyl hydrolase domain-containing protein n=1 Tax=Actinomadura sp. OS1-43 TaxID=604315 RepID=UPI00255A8942|nr:cellulose binding domain-containing protein [Actinomadura sp. OS1-43]MDL4819513.1 cellulose binding domain-containing protein [Actinomadura sp. OS1-43]
MKIPLKSSAVVAAALLAAPFPFLAPAHAATRLCGANDTVAVSGGEYIAQNNVWGASTPQCISVDGTSFTVDSSGHNNSTSGAPASYPSFFKGCHWGRCTTGSGLPVRVGDMPAVASDWSTTQPTSGAYDVAYDLWYDTAPSTTGDPDGAEVMIWLNHRGGVNPAGSRIASGVQFGGATWDVWYSRMNWNYIAYVRTSGTTSVSGLDLRAFTRDAVSRGYISNDWYFIDAEAGFEIWQGGAGLGTDAFSVSVGGTTTPPTTPPPTSPPPTSPPPTSPPPTGERGCSASLHVDNAWNDGFTATVTVTDTGDAPLSGWSADWSFAGGQRVANAWNATVTQSGQSVHAVNASYNGAVPAHGSTSFGFQGSGSAPGTPAVACTGR